MGYATCGVTAEGLESLSSDTDVFLQLLVQFQLCLISVLHSFSEQRGTVQLLIIVQMYYFANY